MTSEHGQGVEGTAGKEVTPVTGHSTPGHPCLAQGWPMTVGGGTPWASQTTITAWLPVTQSPPSLWNTGLS